VADGKSAFPRDVGQRDRAVQIGDQDVGFSDLEPAVRASVEGYNRDDCLSAMRLREWLETLRAGLAAKGAELPRPALKSGDPSKALDERERKATALREKLLSVDDRARYLLAYLLDWHRREDKAVWWEYFRLRDLPDEDLLDERDVQTSHSSKTSSRSRRAR